MTNYQYTLQQHQAFLKLDLQVAYNFISYMTEKTSNLYPPLLDNSSTSDDEQMPEHLKITPEEKTYGTIPGSAIATTVALMHSKPQVNPVVPRGKGRKLKTTPKKTTMALVPKATATQTVQSSVCSILWKKLHLTMHSFKYGLNKLQPFPLPSVWTHEKTIYS